MIEFSNGLCAARSDDDLNEALTKMQARKCTRLYLNCNGFARELSALSEANWLTSIRIESARIADISPLYNCTSLQSLQIIDCKFKGSIELSPFRHTLQYLYLKPVGMVRGLQKCQQLEKFYCGTYNAGENLLDLRLTSGLSKLADLSFFTSKFDDFRNVACPGIRSVDLYRCGQLSSLTGLERFSELEVLEVNTKVLVQDFSALAACKSLRRLLIRGKTEIDDLGFLRSLPRLTELVIEPKVSDRDLSPILECDALQLLHITSGPDFSHTLKDLKRAVGLMMEPPGNTTT